ncbi:acyltransferase family protein [Cognaticolwellia beringensis]|uniref:Acyltransferase n=1 Tax=Cognaticolwellia beringensis TaxID=1967665 RepID=A0A222G856_9GAMM|nr:acyltransferase [Cognaticolwellia beringensis]ASP47980.1 acyltransferase [Cognaticolwellia beringensis]
MSYQNNIALSSVIDSKNNNFNLIRMLAALAVIVSHSYALALGNRELEPIKNLLGISLGSIAVDIFFITSGLLVTRSLLVRTDLKFFIVSRILRIFPALLVSVLFCVILGAYLTSFSLQNYLQDSTLLNFIIYNSTIIITDYQELPGVFYNAPLDSSVNGSLWTLPWELRMYVVLIGMGVLSYVLKKVNITFPIVPAIIVLIAISSTALYFHFHFNENFHWFYYKFFRFASAFFIGGGIYVLRNHISLNLKWVVIILSLLIFALYLNKATFFVMYIFTMPYLVLCAAYLPKGKILKYNTMGDFSYGTYIYAWPIQQTIAINIIGISPTEMTILAGTIVIVLSAISWNFIEKPSMKLKRYFI